MDLRKWTWAVVDGNEPFGGGKVIVTGLQHLKWISLQSCHLNDAKINFQCKNKAILLYPQPIILIHEKQVVCKISSYLPSVISLGSSDLTSVPQLLACNPCLEVLYEAKILGVHFPTGWLNSSSFGWPVWEWQSISNGGSTPVLLSAGSSTLEVWPDWQVLFAKE